MKNKNLMLLMVLVLGLFSLGATKNIVPRADSEGSIGTSSKNWQNSYFDNISVDGTVTIPNDSLTTSKIVELNSATATAGRIFIADGTDFESQALAGDATVNGAGFLALTANSVGEPELDVTDTPSDGECLSWDTATQRFEWVTCGSGGGATQLTDLTDVNTATVTAGRILIADGTDFESMAVAGDASMNGAGFLTISTINHTLNVAGSGTSTFSGPIVATSFNGLAINSATATAGRILVADGTDFESMALQGSCTMNGAGFISCTASGSSTDLAGLTDVNTATASAGRILVADGTDFESMAVAGDATMNGAGFLSLATDSVGSAEIAADAVGASEIAADSVGTSELTFINSSTATAGRIFVANGNDFDSVALSGDATIASGGAVTLADGSLSLSELSDVNTATVTAGSLLIADGTSWESVTFKSNPCLVISDVTSSDDNFPLSTKPIPRTVLQVGCRCHGTCTTKANIALEDDSGNAMTHSTPTCATAGTVITYQNVTAANTLIAGEGLRMDVTNTPSPATDEYEVCWQEFNNLSE